MEAECRRISAVDDASPSSSRVAISRVRVERLQSRAQELLDRVDGQSERTFRIREKDEADLIAEGLRGLVHDLMEIDDDPSH